MCSVIAESASGRSATAKVLNIRNRMLGTATIVRSGRDSLVITCVGCQRADSRQVIHFEISPQGDFTGGAELAQEWIITHR